MSSEETIALLIGVNIGLFCILFLVWFQGQRHIRGQDRLLSATEADLDNTYEVIRAMAKKLGADDE